MALSFQSEPNMLFTITFNPYWNFFLSVREGVGVVCKNSGILL